MITVKRRGDEVVCGRCGFVFGRLVPEDSYGHMRIELGLAWTREGNLWRFTKRALDQYKRLLRLYGPVRRAEECADPRRSPDLSAITAAEAGTVSPFGDIADAELSSILCPKCGTEQHFDLAQLGQKDPTIVVRNLTQGKAL